MNEKSENNSTLTELSRELIARHPKSKLEKTTPETIEVLRKDFPGIPDDYLQFLAHVGSGSIGASRFKIYSEPILPKSIYDEETAAALDGIVLVGDDFSGYCVGYDTRSNFAIGEVSSVENSASYIRQRLLLSLT